MLLLSMPFSSLHYPSLGLSLLKPALQAASIDVAVRYEFFRFADMIGAASHALIDQECVYHSLVGEWIFASAAHDRDPLDLAFIGDILLRRFSSHLSLERVHAVLQARDRVPGFLEACLDAVERDGPAIVGFTTSFQQTCASLALARRIKARSPATIIVFGGANCRDEMGVELLRQFGFIDAVCLGEGDRAFPAYAHGILSGAPPARTPGILERRHLEAGVDGGADLISDLDQLPLPDFDEFFTQHAASRAAMLTSTPTALFETSRGCWWGQRSHCTFCGINGSAMAYRSKSQARAYDEISYLARRFGPDIVNVDAILDPSYFDTFIPRLAEQGPLVTVYQEVKANLTPGQMTALSRAGFRKIQPGIESLETEVLRLMRKGCTMLQNVQTLKLAAENGLYAEWNLLYGFPGETPDHDRCIAALMPKLVHLQPPAMCGAVRADRFSPYWSHPEQFGIAIELNQAYRYIYPFSPDVVARLAYHFEIEMPRDPDNPETVSQLKDAAAAWRDGHERSCLTLRTSDTDGVEVEVEVEEGRAGRTGWTRRFTGAAAYLLQACWHARPWHELARSAGGENCLRLTLAELVDLDLVLVERGRVLTLALRQPGYGRAPNWSEIKAGRTVPFTWGNECRGGEGVTHQGADRI